MKNAENPAKDAQDNGFDGFLIKPFDDGQVNDFLSQYYDAQDLVTLEDNVMALTSFPANKDRLGKTVSRIMKLTQEYIEKCAAACYEDVIMDMTATPPGGNPSENLASCPKTPRKGRTQPARSRQ